MSAEYTVTRAFQATGEDKQTPEVVNTKAGACHKYIFQVDEYPGWFNTLRKIEDGKSRPLAVGDTVYGDFEENNYGKLAFVKAQKPFTPGQPQQSAPAAKPAAQPSNSNTEAKLDYIISLLENFLGTKSESKPQPATTSAPDGDAPVDLSQIEY